MDQTAHAKLSEVSRLLLRIHKVLLHFQKEIHENLNQKALTPHEFLNLSMTHEDFSWLRKITALIILIDEAVDNKDPNLDNLWTEVALQIRQMFFSDAEGNLKERLLKALTKDASLQVEIVQLRQKIGL